MNVKVKIIIIISVLLITGITLYFLLKKTDHCKNKNKLDYCDDQCTKLRADYCDDQCTKRKVPQKCCDITKLRADYCDDDCTKLRSEHCDDDCSQDLRSDHCGNGCSQDLRSKYCHRNACLSLTTDHCGNDCNQALRSDYCDDDCTKLRSKYCDNDCKTLRAEYCDDDCTKLRSDHCDNDCSKALRSNYCYPLKCELDMIDNSCSNLIAASDKGIPKKRQKEKPFLITGKDGKIDITNNNESFLKIFGTWLFIDRNEFKIIRNPVSKNMKIWYTNPKVVPGTGPFRLILQSDGNLVMYDKEDRVIFDGETQINPFNDKKGMFLLKFTDPSDPNYNTYPLYVIEKGGTDKHYVQNLILQN